MPDPATWSVTARDWFSNTREYTEQLTDPGTGASTPRIHTLVQLGAGLNYLDSSGNWQESLDLIELASDGGAAAVHGPHKVRFSPDATVTITTRSNRVSQVRATGVFLFDAAAGTSRLLAALSPECAAELIPPNQVLYRGAFASDVFHADLRYTYTREGLESDVIVTSQPKLTPEACGFDPATTRLQVRHEWLNMPAPKITERVLEHGAGPDLVDQILDFGDLWFPTGRAFSWEGDGSDTNVPARINLPSPGGDTNGVEVAKTWVASASSSTLIESVTWTSIAPKLAQLPQLAGADAAPATGQLAAGEAWPLWQEPLRKRAIELAGRPSQAPGLVLDWVFTGPYQSDFTFTNYARTACTYEITSDFYTGGTVTFQPGCVVKFVPGVYMLLYGGVVSQGTQSSRSVLTSAGDNVYGDPIAGYSKTSGASTALWLYYISTNVALSGMNIRYAGTAVELDANSCGSLTHTLANSALFTCQTGVFLNGPNVSFQGSVSSHVSTPIWWQTECGTVSGTLTNLSSTTDPDGIFCRGPTLQGLNSDAPGGAGIPTDISGAVGPANFMEVFNYGAVAVYNKVSGALLTPPTSLAQFFALTVSGGPYAGTYPANQGGSYFVFDPRVIYDQGSQRWFVSAVDRYSTNILLAVSHNSSPVGSGGSTWVSDNWTKYLVPAGVNPTPCFQLDYDVLGLDGNGVYITVTPQGLSRTARVAALPKAPLLNGTAQQVQTSFIFDVGGLLGYAVFPAVNFDPVGPTDPAWFIWGDTVNTITYSELVWQNGLGSQPVFQSWRTLTVTETAEDVSLMMAPQKGSSTAIDFGYSGSFLMTAMVRKIGGAQYLWTCHTVGVNINGNYDNQVADRSAVEWFKLDLPNVAGPKSGRIFDSTSQTSPMFYYYPSLAVNSYGQAVLGFAGSGANSYVSAFYTGLLDGGASPSAPVCYYAGTQAWNGSAPVRLGDFSETSSDPDGITIWTVQQYLGTQAWQSYGTAIGAVTPF